jgi:hypothetical protein
MNAIVRPRLRGYVGLFAAWSLGWTAYIASGYYALWSHTGIEAPGMAKNITLGILGGAAVIGLLFFGAWHLRPANASSAATTTATQASSPPIADARPETLELRGVGVRVDAWAQTDLWKSLKAQKDSFQTILSTDPKDYPNNSTSVGDKSNRGLASAFKYSAGEAVERWPIPVIIFGPPNAGGNHATPAGYIASNRQQASLALHLFTWVQATNVSNPQAQIDFLFDFFDKHPTVPAVLIFGMDGLRIRSGFGGDDVPEGQHVPAQFDAMVGLLVTRSDRVNHYMRPFVTDDPEDAGMDDKQYDSIKLWNFFWHYENDVMASDSIGMPEESAWAAQLPTLWKTLSNKGPGDFKPDVWFPARWAKWQLAEFDNAPLLGYLHRPIAVNLKDEQGHLLRGAAQAQALHEGWAKVQAQLLPGQKVDRLFFDSTGDKTLLPLLHTTTSQNGPDPTSLTEGFDVGHRLGNVGIMGAMVGIGLSAIASYDDGQGSVTVNPTSDGQLHFILVTPPSADEKAANTNMRKLPPDPFIHLVPSA